MKRVIMLLFAIWIVGDSDAQVFNLLKDINATPFAASSNPKGLAELNGNIYFVAATQTTGYALWKSNGTDAGTVIVKDGFTIDPFTPFMMMNVNGVLYFLASDYIHGVELWKSDGTTAGTGMVKDINPGAPHSDILDMTAVNSNIFFTAYNPDTGKELWKSDGTEAGTVMVKDILPGPGFGLRNDGSSPILTNVNGVLYFVAYHFFWNETLLKSDGTSVGTVLVKDLNAITSGINLNGVFVFAGEENIGTGYELMKSDGTEGGTVLIKDINDLPGVSSMPGSFTIVNGILYFAASNETPISQDNRELWRSDGTLAGTYRVKDINPLIAGSDPTSLKNVNGTLFFSAKNNNNDFELWKSDGTDAGTVLVKDLVPGATGSYPQPIADHNGTLLFYATTAEGKELWRSDGTSAGTQMVKDIYPGPQSGMVTNQTGMSPVWAIANGVFYFNANDGSTGFELWRSDGTESATSLIKDINPTSTSSGLYGPFKVLGAGNTLYFVADDGVHGDELWKTDGTAAGTVMIRDINPGSAHSRPGDLAVLNGVLYFNADNGVNGRELWKSNGTEAGTVMVKDINPGAVSSQIDWLTVLGNAVYFSAESPGFGRELWKSDGTDAGTIQVKDIFSGNGSSSPASFTLYGSNLFFSAHGPAGRELWKTDGTNAGTVMVKDINVGASSDPANLKVLNGMLLFSATTTISGTEPWISNGTDAGTNLLADVVSGPGNSNPREFAFVNGLYYYVASHPTYGEELWYYFPGFGNFLTTDLNPGTTGSAPHNLVTFNNTLYLIAKDAANGDELRKVNGFQVDVVKDYLPGPGSGADQLFNIQGKMFFAGNNGADGTEPARSNGTASGTVMIQNVAIPGGSNPRLFTMASNKLYVIINDGLHGDELWVANMEAALPLTLLEFNGRLVSSDAILTWKTTNESNTLSFTIERSIDAANYSSIGSVQAANSPGIHTYSFKDLQVTSLGVPVVYYRLKQSDIDVKIIYSRVVQLHMDKNKTIVLAYPNPVIDNLTITLSLNRPERIRARIVDNTGKIVIEKNWNLSTGTTTFSLEMAKLPQGIYHLELKGDSVNEIRKIVK